MASTLGCVSDKFHGAFINREINPDDESFLAIQEIRLIGQPDSSPSARLICKIGMAVMAGLLKCKQLVIASAQMHRVP